MWEKVINALLGQVPPLSCSVTWPNAKDSAGKSKIGVGWGVGESSGTIRRKKAEFLSHYLRESHLGEMASQEHFHWTIA